MDDEYLDLVNEGDEVIGRMLRSEVYARGLSNFRVVNAFVLNDAGELWIPRRGPTKRIFPLALDMSMGGHVSSGETYDEAFARETAEELNIDTTVHPWSFLGKLTPHEHGVSAYMQVYAIKTADAPQYNPDDFVEAGWHVPAALLEKIAAGEKAKDDLSRLVRHFYS
jgi:isopentenyl-diphosphate delta-isomerase